MDYDDGKVRRRFMMNATNNHASTMHVPVICLDDDDNLKIDKDYKIFLDHLIDDNSLGPLFELNSSRSIRYEVDNGESETRKFDMLSGESKRSQVKNEYLMNNRVSEQGKRKTFGFKDEVPRASSSLGVDRERIQRDNRLAERRKKRVALLAREQDNIQRDTKLSESNVESLRDVPIVVAQESIQGDNIIRKIADLKAESSRSAFPLVRAQESIKRDYPFAERRKNWTTMLVRAQDNIQRGMKMSESNVESLRDVPIIIAQESIQGDRVRKILDLKAESSRRPVPSVRDQKGIHRVNNVKVNSLSHVPLVRDQEGIHRVNNVKVNTSGHVPLVRHQEGIPQENSVKVNTSSHVPLVRDQEGIQRDLKVPQGRKRRLSETVRSDVPLVRAKKAIQRDNKVTKTDEFYVYTSSGVRLVRKQEVIQRVHKVSQGRKSKFSQLEPEMLRRNVPLRAEEDIQQDNVISKRRKNEIVETKGARTSKVVPVELKDVSETSRIVQENQRKKNEEERVVVVNKDYMIYLKWLVDSLKDSETTRVENVQNDPADLDPPAPAPAPSTLIGPEKDLLVNVKVEQDLESWSDDSDIIAVSDSPFSDGEVTPFVVSKSVVDLDKESKDDESRSCLFTKELMDVLKKPYNEKELLNLSKEASMQKPVTRCRELRKGREKFYATGQMGLSYLQKFSDFNKVYKVVDGVDKAKALKLLRGFFFYLRNCSRDGAFEPWSKDL